jgi:2,3-bisphosphoglycerate-independent phosphoglycerate mutase
MHILLIFLDGIGLGDDNPSINPFAAARMPTLTALTNGKRWLRGIGRQESERAIFIPTDPRLDVAGRPQSGTGQATILTGLNVPQLIGEHYGPKPNLPVRQIIAQDNIFKQVIAHGQKAAIINAYPLRLHHAIARGKTLRSSIQQALNEAGLPMFEDKHIYSGDALSEDWTGYGWRAHLGYSDTPLYEPREAGIKMVQLSRRYHFSFFSHWMTDVIGHRGPLEDGVRLLELFDSVMAGALDEWNDDEGLMIVTSDHGNMEDVSDRHHTENDVPTLIIGGEKQRFAEGLQDLSDFVPRMAQLLFNR